MLDVVKILHSFNGPSEIKDETHKTEVDRHALRSFCPLSLRFRITLHVDRLVD